MSVPSKASFKRLNSYEDVAFLRRPNEPGYSHTVGNRPGRFPRSRAAPATVKRPTGPTLWLRFAGW